MIGPYGSCRWILIVWLRWSSNRAAHSNCAGTPMFCLRTCSDACTKTEASCQHIECGRHVIVIVLFLSFILSFFHSCFTRTLHVHRVFSHSPLVEGSPNVAGRPTPSRPTSPLIQLNYPLRPTPLIQKKTKRFGSIESRSVLGFWVFGCLFF